MSILFVLMFAAVAAQENPILLASKDFLNDVIAEGKHLTMHYVIHNIGTEVANDVVVSKSSCLSLKKKARTQIVPCLERGTS